MLSMTEDQCRNTLIVIIHEKTGENVHELQGKSNDELMQKGRCLITKNPNVALLSQQARLERARAFGLVGLRNRGPSDSRTGTDEIYSRLLEKYTCMDLTVQACWQEGSGQV